jgi:hypothetical protein
VRLSAAAWSRHVLRCVVGRKGVHHRVTEPRRPRRADGRPPRDARITVLERARARARGRTIHSPTRARAASEVWAGSEVLREPRAPPRANAPSHQIPSSAPFDPGRAEACSDGSCDASPTRRHLRSDHPGGMIDRCQGWLCTPGKQAPSNTVFSFSSYPSGVRDPHQREPRASASEFSNLKSPLRSSPRNSSPSAPSLPPTISPQRRRLCAHSSTSAPSLWIPPAAPVRCRHEPDQ